MDNFQRAELAKRETRRAMDSPSPTEKTYEYSLQFELWTIMKLFKILVFPPQTALLYFVHVS